MVDVAGAPTSDIERSNSTRDLATRCKIAWLRLPPVIRCATLLNEYRVAWNKTSGRNEENERTSMCVPDLGKTLLDAKGTIPPLTYQVKDSADSRHIPHLTTRKADFTWSWNRDEYADATITYRVYLCPLWAGASGHTAGGIQFWLHSLLPPDFGDDGAIVVAASLFVLWRLYYDRRITGNHTLVETFESTCIPSITGPLEGVELPQRGDDLEGSPDDAWHILQACSCNLGGSKLHSLDPLRLLSLLEQLFVCNRSQAGLEVLIDKERLAVSEFYWMPQWSKELTPKISVDVASFTRDTYTQKYSSKVLTEPQDIVLSVEKSDGSNSSHVGASSG